MKTGSQVSKFYKNWQRGVKTLKKMGLWSEIVDCWTMGLVMATFLGLCYIGAIFFVAYVVGNMATPVVGCLTGLLVAILGLVFVSYKIHYWHSSRTVFVWYTGVWPTCMVAYDMVCLLIGMLVGWFLFGDMVLFEASPIVNTPDALDALVRIS